GIVCVRSTRVATGDVGRNVEVKDDSIGTVASLALNAQKSRVLLRLALLKTSDPVTIQRYLDEYCHAVRLGGGPAPHSSRVIHDASLNEAGARRRLVRGERFACIRTTAEAAEDAR